MKPHLSYSQIGMFLRCPRQYEFRYMQGLKMPPSGAMIQGKAWHETLERNYRQKIQSAADLPLGEMRDFFATRFDEAVGAEEVAFDTNEGPGNLKDQGITIVETHHRIIAPAVRPLLVEEKFTVDLGPDFPFDLTGIWDLIEAGGVIADNKSFSRTPAQDDVDKDLQFSIYALAYRALRGEVESGLRMDAVIKNKVPKAVQIHTSRTNEECRWVLGLIEQVARAIKSGIFFPNPGSWMCGPKSCGYYALCKKPNR